MRTLFFLLLLSLPARGQITVVEPAVLEIDYFFSGALIDDRGTVLTPYGAVSDLLRIDSLTGRPIGLKDLPAHQILLREDITSKILSQEDTAYTESTRRDLQNRRRNKALRDQYYRYPGVRIEFFSTFAGKAHILENRNALATQTLLRAPHPDTAQQTDPVLLRFEPAALTGEPLALTLQELRPDTALLIGFPYRLYLYDLPSELQYDIRQHEFARRIIQTLYPIVADKPEDSPYGKIPSRLAYLDLAQPLIDKKARHLAVWDSLQKPLTTGCQDIPVNVAELLRQQERVFQTFSRHRRGVFLTRLLTRESVGIFHLCHRLYNHWNNLVGGDPPGVRRKMDRQFLENLKRFYTDHDLVVDAELFAILVPIYLEEIDPGFHSPSLLVELGYAKKNYQTLWKRLTAKTILADSARVLSAFRKDPEQAKAMLQQDYAYRLWKDMTDRMEYQDSLLFVEQLPVILDGQRQYQRLLELCRPAFAPFPEWDGRQQHLVVVYDGSGGYRTVPGNYTINGILLEQKGKTIIGWQHGGVFQPATILQP